MKDMAEFINGLLGELLATQVAIRGLLQARPELHVAVERELERFRVEGLNQAVPDALLAGFDKAETRLLTGAGEGEPGPPPGP